MWSQADPENPAIDRLRAIVRKGKP
jgi:hypothetical protein